MCDGTIPLAANDLPAGLTIGRGSRGGTLRELKAAVNAAFRRVRAPSRAWRRRADVRPVREPDIWSQL